MGNEPHDQPTELALLDATAQADLVRTGQASPSELVNAAIERIERINPKLNAVIRERFALAKAEANTLDNELANDTTKTIRPFAGVPMLLKDLGLSIEGEALYNGTRFLKNIDYRATYTSYLYEKFRNAGFIAVGRTNTPEWGTTITTEPLSYGPSRNPWNTDHSTGGSSGGSGAAVAAGLTPIAHAGDGGGSIRIPASECGLVGLKPTRARVSMGPKTGAAWMGAVAELVVSRTMRDTAAILDAVQGPMPGDPYVAPAPTRSYVHELNANPKGLRIGFSVNPTREGTQVHPECIAAVNKTAQVLSALSHRVDEACPEGLADVEFGEHYIVAVVADVAWAVAEGERILQRPIGDDDIEPENAFYNLFGKQVDAVRYLQAENYMYTYQRRMAQWWASTHEGGAGYDLLVTPTIALPPPPIGWLGDSSAPAGERVRSLLQYTAQFNVTGQPAISLPVHISADGLPVGVQIVAPFGREDLLIAIGSQLEQAMPWNTVLPRVHG
jgi:amidase